MTTSDGNLKLTSFSFTTPTIPGWIADIELPGYTNVFGYRPNGISPFPAPQHPNLWGTETLFGDWNGCMLIVLKDFAHTSFLASRNDGRPPYSHAPALVTNANLV